MEVDPSPVRPSDETTALADTLIIALWECEAEDGLI